MYSLRPYQQEAVDATVRYFRNHKKPACIVLPTGAGKSLVIAELARIANGRVLVLAHVKVGPISVMRMVTTISLGRTVPATGEMIFW